ncbi:MAG: restriction endonuclease subunit S [Paludibacter sp.]|nr:restriction endonuclease subunit S [Paludibacter sp.]
MNNNTIYKDSPLGKIPNDWSKSELGKLLETLPAPYKLSTNEYLIKGKYPIVDQGKKQIVAYTNNDDAIINNLPALIFGDHTKEIKLIKFPFAVGGDGVKILNSKEIEIEYLKFLLEKSIKRLPDLGYSRYFVELKNKIEIYPKRNEQKVIANLISTWDNAICNVKELIEQFELRNKWLKQALLTGKKKIKGFENEKWSKKSLKDILIPVRNSLIPEENVMYQQIGIRSHTKGIFYKEKVIGATLGDKRVFWIEPNCFIVNIVFAWEHAIAKTTENEIGMIASHRFPMFKPKESVLDLDYLLYYFKSPRGKSLLELASPGGAGRNKTLGQSEFMKLQIPVPSLEEQIAIAQVLQMADKEIYLLRNKQDMLKEQKEGLMQVLLTGKKRLKTN